MTLSPQAALDYIHSFDDPYLRALREQGSQTWGIAGMKRLLQQLDNPHRAYPTIHIAGTKGKGSTAAFITRGLMESGLKVGLYTSPHLQRWHERIQINRQWIGGKTFARLVEDFQAIAGDMPLSEFEATTALAFWHFARQECDVAVIEVGLGGRLDATNVLQPAVAVITSISKDHTQLLGDKLEDIAAEKAAIIKPGSYAVSAPQHRYALQSIEKRVRTQRCEFTLVGRDFLFEPVELRWDGSLMEVGDRRHTITVEVGMPGVFQCENAAVALAALGYAERAGLPVTRQARLAALKNTRWPGRLEVIKTAPRVILDSAHNPFSVKQVIKSLHQLDDGVVFRKGARTIVFGCMADKDVQGMLDALVPIADRLILTRADRDRAADPENLREMALTAMGLRGPQEIITADAIEDAVAQGQADLRDDDTLLITGSLAVAGEARTALMGLPAQADS